MFTFSSMEEVRGFGDARPWIVEVSKEQNVIVSSDNDTLILVNSRDEPTGALDKWSCHEGEGRLHRAFSVFLFNSAGDLLVQRRSATKRLWPRYWSNSCCSHPRLGEDTVDAAHRRVAEELGMTASLDYLYKFEYEARFGSIGTEREVCSVFVGRSDAEPEPNENELDDLRWMSVGELDAELAARPQSFTPWFVLEWERVRQEIQ